ncbi:MAG: hypothetical protein NDJ89_04210 [Oligoflexia bacterium]|nr:hypothetical protein [Oligoflexia bacterium]
MTWRPPQGTALIATRAGIYLPLLLAASVFATLSGCSLEYIGKLRDLAQTSPILIEPQVAPRYAAAADWNAYVKAAATDTPCDGNEPGYYDCVHGGEKKRVDFPGTSSCAEYQIHDELQAFDWGCDDSGGAARLFFFSRGLKSGKGLADLLDASGWKTNRVLIRRAGALVAASPVATWWGNPVQPLPANEALDTFHILNAPGTIYTVAQSMVAQGGYQFAANGGGNRIAIVIMPGRDLTFAGSTPACYAMAISDCLLDLTTSRFFWIEGTLKSLAFGRGIAGNGAAHGVIRKVSAMGFSSGVGATNGYISSTLYTELRLWNNQIGLSLKGTRNIIQDILAFNNNAGLFIGDVSPGNLIQRASLLKNSSTGNDATSTTDLIAISTDMLVLTGSSGGNIHNLLTGSAQLTNIGQVTIAQFVMESIILSLVTDGKFTGNWVSNSAPTCTLSGGNSTPGLDAACTATGASDFVRTTANGISAPYDRIFTDDALNASDSAGGAAFESITDWLNFENPWRGWGPDWAQLCEAGALCRIFDFRVLASDTRIRNTTGNGASQNPGFQNGELCPPLLDGNVVTVDQSTPPRTYLRNAIEILGREGGNHNGFCESGETCLYTPNFGAYQGEGDFTTKSCVFKDGIVSGVKIYAYPVNGPGL